MRQRNLYSNDRPDLNPEIRFLAEKEELGELRQVYHASKRYTPVRLLGWLLLGWGICFLIFAILAILFSPTHPSPALTLLGFIPLVVGGYMVLPRSIYARWHVYLWESGFLYERRLGRACSPLQGHSEALCLLAS